MKAAALRGAHQPRWPGCSRPISARPRTQLRVCAYAGRDDAKWRQLPAVGPEQACQGYWVSLLSRALSDFSEATLDANEFTPSTFAAVLEFQHRNGLECSGVVTPNTWAALLSHNEVLRSEALDPISWHGPYQQYVQKENGRVMYETPWDTLHEMSIGATSLYWVGRLQSMLTTAGFQLEEQELANCCLGPSTWAAVLSYQDQTPGLDATGILDSLTWASLSSHVNNRVPVAPGHGSQAAAAEEAAAATRNPADEERAGSTLVAVLSPAAPGADGTAGPHKLHGTHQTHQGDGSSSSEEEMVLVTSAVLANEAAQSSSAPPPPRTQQASASGRLLPRGGRAGDEASSTGVRPAAGGMSSSRGPAHPLTNGPSSGDSKAGTQDSDNEHESLSEQALRDLMDLEAEMHALRMEREQLRLHALLMKQQERAMEEGQGVDVSGEASWGGEVGASWQEGQRRGGSKRLGANMPPAEGHVQTSAVSDSSLQPGGGRQRQGGARGWSGKSARSRRVARRLPSQALPVRQHQLPAPQEVALEQEAVPEMDAASLLSQHQDLYAADTPLQHLPVWEVSFPVLGLHHQGDESPLWADILHVALQRKGFFHPGLKFEGSYFGMGSHAAVVAFQGSAGLPATGVVDGPTWSALLRHEPQLQSIAYAAL